MFLLSSNSGRVVSVELIRLPESNGYSVKVYLNGMQVESFLTGRYDTARREAMVHFVRLTGE